MVVSLSRSLADAREFSNFPDQVFKNIRIVIGAFSLDNHAETLETHAGVDMPVWQALEFAVGFAVVLDENQVPDLNHQGVVPVDQLTAVNSSPFLVISQVDVDLRAGSAWTGVAHFPKIVLF